MSRLVLSFIKIISVEPLEKIVLRALIALFDSGELYHNWELYPGLDVSPLRRRALGLQSPSRIVWDLIHHYT